MGTDDRHRDEIPPAVHCLRCHQPIEPDQRTDFSQWFSRHTTCPAPASNATGCPTCRPAIDAAHAGLVIIDDLPEPGSRPFHLGLAAFGGTTTSGSN